MKTIIAGSRTITDIGMVCSFIDNCAWDINEVVCGLAKGVDSIGEKWTYDNERKIEKFPANWDKYGKSAGMIRNKQMLDEGKPDIVLAFTDDLDGSKGTKGMVNLARKAGIPVKVISG